MSRIRGLSLVVMVSAAAVLLSACDPGGAGAPTASPTAATPTQSGSPAVDPAKPLLKELVLTTEGLGELKIGIAPPTGDPSVNLVSFEADACEAEGLPGIWQATYPDTDLGFGPQPPFAIAVTGDAVSRIDVNTPEIFTDMGLHVGSSLDEVLGVYPGGPDAVISHADVSDVYVFIGANGKLQFEVAVDRFAGYWEPSALDTVIFLSAISIVTEPYGIAATGNVIGVCNLG